jgi:hypothetical protein
VRERRLARTRLPGEDWALAAAATREHAEWHARAGRPYRNGLIHLALPYLFKTQLGLSVSLRLRLGLVRGCQFKPDKAIRVLYRSRLLVVHRSLTAMFAIVSTVFTLP